MVKLGKPLALLSVTGAVILSAIVAGNALAADRLQVLYSSVDDGSCPEVGHTVSAEWEHRQRFLDVDARVKTNPSGGDCTEEAFSYSVSAERRFGLGNWRRLDAMARFSADRFSVSAPYAIVDPAGAIILREDGMAAHVVTLRAGSVESVTATLGVSWLAMPWLRVATGLNLAPVDWADGSSSRTAHVGLHATGKALFGDVELSTTAEIGNDLYGQVEADWRTPIAQGFAFSVSAVYAYGLNALAADGPSVQRFAGLTAAQAGAPEDDSLTFGAGISLEF